MATLTNFGQPQIINRAFLPLILATNVERQIKIILSESALAVTYQELILDLKTWLEGQGEQRLADSLNVSTLNIIIEHMAANGQAPVGLAADLPGVDVAQSGPAETTASISGNTISGTYTDAPAGYTAELYLDDTYVKDISGGAFTQNTGGIAIETVRVLYREDATGNLTKFGPVVTL